MDQQKFLEGMSQAACTVPIITTDGLHGREGQCDGIATNRR